MTEQFGNNEENNILSDNNELAEVNVSEGTYSENDREIFTETFNAENITENSAEGNNMYFSNVNSNNTYEDNSQNMYSQDLNIQRQINKERAKLEKKKNKEALKKEKKAMKNGKSSSGFASAVKLVVCAMSFGVIALGTMYFTGDALGIIDTDSDKDSSGKNNVKLSYTDTSNNDVVSTLAGADGTSADLTQVLDVSDVVDNVMPSIVAITSTQKVQSGYGSWYDYYFNNGGSYEEETGAGSGIIIGQNDTELLIVTNNHVVEGADSLQVQFIDNETVEAYIKGTDSEKDLAIVVVKLDDIEEDTMNGIKIATMGNSDELEVGEGTIAIGNALGYGQSVTVGVVSALNREVTIDNRTMELIQTDAAINPGNSGGALLNTKGEVIGINAAKYSSSSVEGMGFAIPVTSVSEIIDELVNMETLTKVDSDKQGYLNIYGRDVTDELSEIYDAPVGVLVVDIVEGGAADKAGLEKSDIITEIEGVKVASMEELQNRLQYYEKGQTITLTVEYMENKEYVEREVEVTLGENME